MVEPADAMGRAVVYLCSDKAKALIGQHFYSRPLLRERGLWEDPPANEHGT